MKFTQIFAIVKEKVRVFKSKNYLFLLTPPVSNYIPTQLTWPVPYFYKYSWNIFLSDETMETLKSWKKRIQTKIQNLANIDKDDHSNSAKATKNQTQIIKYDFYFIFVFILYNIHFKKKKNTHTHTHMQIKIVPLISIVIIENTKSYSH